MQIISHLCLFIIIMVVYGIANAANVYLQIEGLSETLKKNVYAQFSVIQNSNITLDQTFYIRINKIIRNGLKALGYYEPKIEFKLHQSKYKKYQILVAYITPGKQICMGGTNIVLHGDIKTDADYLNLLQDCPKIGSSLNHNDYSNFKKSLIGMSLRKGYFDAHFNINQLSINVNHHKAFWNIDYDSGQRYRFGEVIFKGSQIRNEYQKNIIPFRKGDYYQSNCISELNRRLSSTGWFNSVTIVPKLEQARKTKILPLQVILVPHTKNLIEIGLGYATNTGPRMQAAWKQSWINSYGHSFTTNISISELEQQFNFNYKMPLLKNPLEDYYSMYGGFKRTELSHTESDSAAIVLSRYWDSFGGWQKIINLRWSLDYFTQASIVNTTMLLYPGIMINRTRSHDGAMPIWGDSQQYSINYSNNIWGSDVNFLVTHGQTIWIRTFNNYHRFIIRGNLGWIKTSDLKKVPPSLRFFAGGDRSIRGYKYKSIAPKDNDGNLIGASKLIVGSLEYQYNLIDKWWWTMFIDSGEAVNNIIHSDFKTGIGCGLRWQSLLGPIKLDFTVPVGDKEKHGLQFCISLGPEL